MVVLLLSLQIQLAAVEQNDDDDDDAVEVRGLCILEDVRLDVNVNVDPVLFDRECDDDYYYYDCRDCDCDDVMMTTMMGEKKMHPSLLLPWRAHVLIAEGQCAFVVDRCGWSCASGHRRVEEEGEEEDVRMMTGKEVQLNGVDGSL